MRVRSTSRGPLTNDERAMLEGLVLELGPRLLAYVRRVHGNLPDAEDIVSETFCRAAANIDALRTTDRMDLYVLTIARNLCRDRYRRSHPAATAGNRLAAHSAPGEDPQQALATSERTAAVRAAVSALPDHLREVVILRLSNGLRFEEIANLMAIPLGTALSRMHTAIGRLRKDLDVQHDF